MYAFTRRRDSGYPSLSNHLNRRRPAVQAKFIWAAGSRIPGACPTNKKPPVRAKPLPVTGMLSLSLKHRWHRWIRAWRVSNCAAMDGIGLGSDMGFNRTRKTGWCAKYTKTRANLRQNIKPTCGKAGFFVSWHGLLGCGRTHRCRFPRYRVFFRVVGFGGIGVGFLEFVQGHPQVIPVVGGIHPVGFIERRHRLFKGRHIRQSGVVKGPIGQPQIVKEYFLVRLRLARPLEMRHRLFRSSGFEQHQPLAIGGGPFGLGRSSSGFRFLESIGAPNRTALGLGPYPLNSWRPCRTRPLSVQEAE
jgi:hypothetical protein